MYDEFFSKAHELNQQGIPFATATVVRAEKPTSAKPGDKAIVTIDGVMHGWIGGSCAQPTVVREALSALADDASRLIRLSTSPDEQTVRNGLTDLPMTCFSGGTLEIYIEPQQPRPRLLIIGTLPVAQALAHLAKAMNYHVVVVDPENGGAGMEYAHQIVTTLDTLESLINPLTYVVVATHGNYDEWALERLLRADLVYVGLVSSKRRASAVRDYLTQQGLSEADLEPLHAPAGLDIQARRGDEIALSIMAEIVQKRRNAEQLDWQLFQPQSDEPVDENMAGMDTELGVCNSDSVDSDEQLTHTHGIHGLAENLAVDPICQMTVEVATAKYHSEVTGEHYYFCCAGCKQKFDAKPEAYVQAGLTQLAI